MSPSGAAASLDPGKAWRAEHRIPVVRALDGYRAYAIAGVVLFHIFQVCGGFGRLDHSALGVAVWGLLPRTLDVLFIVSGWVMFMPVAARNGHFGSKRVFAVRRLARVIPGYYAALIVAVILLLTVTNSPGVPGGGILLMHVGLVQTFGPLFDGTYPLGLGVVPPVWTLTVEMTFYVILPFVALWWFRHPFAGLAAAAVLMVAWRELARHAGSAADVFGIHLSSGAESRLALSYASQFPSWALALGGGMTAAWLYVRLQDRWSDAVLRRSAVWGTVASVAALGILAYYGGEQALSLPDPLFGLFASQSIPVALGYPLAWSALLLALSLAPRWLQAPVANRVVTWLADISYGVYLIHFAVIFLVLHDFGLSNDGSVLTVLEWSAIVYPLSIAYAWASARYLERPARRWAHRFGQRTKSKDRAYAAA